MRSMPECPRKQIPVTAVTFQTADNCNSTGQMACFSRKSARRDGWTRFVQFLILAAPALWVRPIVDGLVLPTHARRTCEWDAAVSSGDSTTRLIIVFNEELNHFADFSGSGHSWIIASGHQMIMKGLNGLLPVVNPGQRQNT